jgi:ubiquinone/menaquinone biosynthesis C-methylase UbiE
MRRLLTVFFSLLYNQMAWTYDLVSWTVSVGQWRSWQRASLPYLRGRRILEVAHGTGNLLLDLVSLGFQPVGLDLSPAMGRIARRKLKRSLASDDLPLPLVRGRVQELPFADNAFTTLVSTFPTEFFVQPAAIAEFYRVLEPAGVFVCVPGAQITSLGLADRWAAWLFRVTGQSATAWFDPVLERFTNAGFQARLEQVRQPRGVVILVVAHKAVKPMGYNAA